MSRNILGRGWAFPVTTDVHGNIAFSSYEKSIEESIRIILGTTPGERVMHPDFGCKINDIIFSPDSSKVISLAEHYIKEAIVKWEPRVILKKVTGERDYLNQGLINIKIDYEVRSVNTFFNMVYPFYLERGERDSNGQFR
ncbi:MAG: GPW/gp25 family protein [Treponema sp.]|nr:GPW/gp25 family protein [Treponema sp.]